MKQNRQSKVVAILALCVSILGLTLGFAAFSNTLTISSRATVSPDSSDFNMVIYGMSDSSGHKWDAYYENAQYCNSKDLAIPIYVFYQNITAPNAIIDNDALTIKNIAPILEKPSDSVSYIFKIKNEGKYAAYLFYEDFENIFQLARKNECTPEEGTTAEYVEIACSKILLDAVIMTSDNKKLTTLGVSDEYITILPGEYAGLEISISYHHNYSVLADGAFTVKWDDIKLNFTTVGPSE